MRDLITDMVEDGGGDESPVEDGSHTRDDSKKQTKSKEKIRLVSGFSAIPWFIFLLPIPRNIKRLAEVENLDSDEFWSLLDSYTQALVDCV